MDNRMKPMILELANKCVTCGRSACHTAAHFKVPPEPKVLPETVRTPVVGSRRRCPVCQAVDLTGRQTVCSTRCRRARTRQRERAARQARDREIRALLEMALRKVEEGGP